MELTFDQIRGITSGAVNVEKDESGIRFYRFTKEQMDLYQVHKPRFYKKCYSTSGVKLSFRTDSKNLRLKFRVNDHIGVSFISFDVLVNGDLIGSINNFEDRLLLKDYLNAEFPVGEFSGEFSLGDGTKHVEVHLPWNGFACLQSLSVDDCAIVEPAIPSKKLLVFGDSITYGNAAMHPAQRHIARLSRAMGMEEYNKGIGGDQFFPELAGLKDSFVPDCIFVGYGTNDWRRATCEDFAKNLHGFFEMLDLNYPGIKTLVVTPVWRSDYQLETKFASFMQVADEIKNVASCRKNTLIVEGFDLIPHDTSNFADYGLHPNVDGLNYYFHNLWKNISHWV